MISPRVGQSIHPPLGHTDSRERHTWPLLACPSVASVGRVTGMERVNLYGRRGGNAVTEIWRNSFPWPPQGENGKIEDGIVSGSFRRSTAIKAADSGSAVSFGGISLFKSGTSPLISCPLCLGRACRIEFSVISVIALPRLGLPCADTLDTPDTLISDSAVCHQFSST